MSTPLSIIPLGSIVLVGPGHDAVEATVLRVTIAPEGITYEAGWWSGRTWNTGWFPEGLVQQRSGPRASLGFRGKGGG